MDVSVPHFRNLVSEIQGNSWWTQNFTQRPFDPIELTYSWMPESESITQVPSEPFESLLLRVRRLVMSDSAENLLRVRKEMKRTAQHDTQRRVLDAWYKYWRLAFIKEPYFLEVRGVRYIMTPYKVFDTFVNGQLFHSNNKEYNLLLHGAETPATITDPLLFLRCQFYQAVINFCLAALGLVVCIDFLDTEEFAISGHVHGVTEFVWFRDKFEQLDDQYGIFNGWIEDNGGCSKCRWT